MNDYADADVRCPFFVKQDKASIVCEGVECGTVIKTIFRNDDGSPRMSHKAKYSSAHCTSNYEDCLIYQMLEAKYE